MWACDSQDPLGALIKSSASLEGSFPLTLMGLTGRTEGKVATREGSLSLEVQAWGGDPVPP